MEETKFDHRNLKVLDELAAWQQLESPCVTGVPHSDQTHNDPIVLCPAVTSAV